MPADLGAMFANLLGKSGKADEGTEETQAPSEAKASKGRTAGDHPFGQADIDLALLAQLNAFSLKQKPEATSGEPHAATGKGVGGPAIADLKALTGPDAAGHREEAGKGKPLTVADAAKLLAGKTHPAIESATPKPTQKPTATPDQQLKALNQAATTAKHHAAPAQTTAAKALPLHLANANTGTGGDNGNQTNSRQPQQQQQQQYPSSDSANLEPAGAAKALPQAQAPAPAASPQAYHTAAQPAQMLTGIAPAHPAAASTQTTPAVLQIAPQAAAAAAQPNLGSLAVSIAAKSKNGEKHFDIRLDPPELGRVEVKLSFDDAGKAQANLAVEKPHTLELLQRDRSTLERALRDAGVDLAGGSLNFSLKGQDREQNGAAPQRGRALSVSAIADNASDLRIPAHNLVAADSRLDIRV